MRPLVVFSGAGLSADSGIQTFRDKDGLWENHKVEDVADHAAWFKNKELVLRFYAERYEKYKNCKPHAGHEALAKLEEKFDVTHVTQNVDTLLEDAGCSNVTHLHGLLKSKKCEWHQDINKGEQFHCDYKAEANSPVELGDCCPACGGQMRPDIVWFNEQVHHTYEDIVEKVKAVKYNEGVFISVGTSGNVYPAAFYISLFSQVPQKYLMDKKPSPVGNYELIEGPAAETLPTLVEKLLSD